MSVHPSFVNIDSDIMDPRLKNAWVSGDGRPEATVGLGASTIFLRSPEDARALSAACIAAAEAMEALAAGDQGSAQ